uniref:Uncharacterized protein n=1 Tax=Saccharolobus islandicus TaxID=43080 RepID=Q0ZNV2_SACIS|nr:hypothetical protein [Sulfolobus islandicus]ABE99614.1 hypothetical protein [Sulfolobus islandicus]
MKNKDKKEDWLHDPEYNDMNINEKYLYDHGWKELAKREYRQRKMNAMTEDEWWIKNSGVTPPKREKIKKSYSSGFPVWPIMRIALIFGGIFFFLWILGQMMASVNSGFP